MLRPSTTISVALCLACACLVWTATAARRAPERGDTTPTLRWVPGTRQHYSLATEVVARMHLPGSERSAPVQAKLSGILELAIEDVDAAGARARFRLAPASYSGAGADRAAEIGLSTPFHVAFRADGLPLRVDFPTGLADEARMVLEELVRTVQVVVASGSGAGWTTLEENATGRYRADYRVARDGTLVKEKAGFEEVAARAIGSLGSLEVRLLRSRARVRLDPGASWVEAVELEEEARFLADGKPILESTLRATLTRTTEPLAILEERASPSLAELAPSAGRSAAEATPAPAPPPIDLGAALARLLEDLERSGGKSTASVHALRDLFATYPAAAREACAALAAGALGDLPAAALINALQLAGTPAAQEALGSILAGAGFGRTNRLRAVLALGALELPTTEALDDLWGAASQRSSDEAEELADTCLLALGTLAPSDRAANAQELGQELGPVETRLVARLATAGDEDEQGILLGALGNAQNGALAPTVAPYLESDSAYVRSSAADALGNMPSPAVESALAGRLEQEPNPRVRASLASALRRMPEPSPASLVFVQSLVVREESDSARVEMAAFLGEHLDVLPAARQTLDDLMRNDGSPRVRSCAAEALLRP